MKSKRQVNYNSNNGDFRSSVETPFSVGLGLYVHQKTRSKDIVNTLSGLKLSISYEKVLQIETDIANAVAVSAENNGGIYVPPNIISSVPIHFAIDNTDFSNDTPDGKNEFHGTGQIVFQKKQAFENETQLVIERSGERNLKFKKETAKIKTCFKPNP